MHRVAAARWLNRALRIGEAAPSAGVPVYPCPTAGRSGDCWPRKRLVVPAPALRRMNHTAATRVDDVGALPPAETPVAPAEAPEAPAETPKRPARKLPLTCSGCGAFSQTGDPHQLGYFDKKTKRVRTWLDPGSQKKRSSEPKAADEVVSAALKALGDKKLAELGLSSENMASSKASQAIAVQALQEEKPPVCQRCYDLLHYNAKSDTAKLTTYHPTVESLRETIEESPYRDNHIYHVIDAADFPMSLMPRLNLLLGDVFLRTRNRRSKTFKYSRGRKVEMSFIITRSDLLAPKKEMVDAMMPYLQLVLRDALGRVGDRVRLGNVRCVSPKRGWWTREVRHDVWERGGAGWMVGKVNVGKSALFEAIYPKGRIAGAEGAFITTYPRDAVGAESLRDGAVEQGDEAPKDLHVGELLPPPQPAQNYPEMPVVSSLPGTTASPIRIPFGNGKGELIDLPGLARSDLELFVKEEHRQSLIMKSRIIPEQMSVQTGQSLILGGGLIRITPRTPGTVFLMYNFTPLDEHLTATDKAVDFQEQKRHSVGVENIAMPGVGDVMEHAGTFKLRHDVTKTRAGPLTRKNAIGLKVDRLPFRVLSVDIVIEGVGYVEVVAQVRARDVDPWLGADDEPQDSSAESDDPFAQLTSQRRDGVARKKNSDSGKKRGGKSEEAPHWAEPEWPAVDVYTPEGRFVASRRPIQGWMNNKPRVLAKHKRSRPRRSMKGQKKKTKQERRAAEAVS